MTATTATRNTTTNINIPMVSPYADIPTPVLEVILGGLVAEANSWDLGGSGYAPRNPRKLGNAKLEDGAITLIGGKAKARFTKDNWTKGRLRDYYRTICQTEDAVRAELARREDA